MPSVKTFRGKNFKEGWGAEFHDDSEYVNGLVKFSIYGSNKVIILPDQGFGGGVVENSNSYRDC